MSFEVSREHEFCAGHRVHGHESKCAHLHGHNYVVTFYCRAAAGLDKVGRVIDFAVIKERLCEWLEENWDHRMLLWEADPLWAHVVSIDPTTVRVPFNPTAENMAKHLVRIVGPQQLLGTGVELFSVQVRETGKCAAWYTLGVVESFFKPRGRDIDAQPGNLLLEDSKDG